jgi:N-acetylmuramoyl-L-alanine amidase
MTKAMRAVPDSPVAAKVFPSPNHDERRDGRRPDMLMLHYTGMPDEGEALKALTDPLRANRVSSHYFVFGNGHVLQLVPEARRAWHAGAGSWQGQADINSQSIGIEIANPGHAGGLPPFPDEQMQAVQRLCQDIVARWRIRPERVLAHSDTAPSRKEDPGEGFDWRRLAEAGVGLWVRPAPIRDGRYFTLGDEGPPVEALQAMFALFGYDVPVHGRFDEATRLVVAAFQRHWRQEKVDGVADASTITTLRDLIRARDGGADGIG